MCTPRGDQCANLFAGFAHTQLSSPTSLVFHRKKYATLIVSEAEQILRFICYLRVGAYPLRPFWLRYRQQHRPTSDTCASSASGRTLARNFPGPCSLVIPLRLGNQMPLDAVQQFHVQFRHFFFSFELSYKIRSPTGPPPTCLRGFSTNSGPHQLLATAHWQPCLTSA